MQYSDILHRCFRCGYCKLPSSYEDFNCPAYLAYRFETYSPGGRMWLLRAMLNEEIEPGERMGEILFSCAACGNCVEHCVFPKFRGDLLNAFIAGRGELVGRGAVPPPVRDFFKALQTYGNPYKMPESGRGDWAEGLGVEKYSGQEYLLFVGCAASFDERGRKMARAVAGLLKRLGVSFGIFAGEEKCDGNEARTMGEEGLFELLARENIEKFRDNGVKNIITVSPHGYHAIKNEYPRFGGSFPVSHYSQVLAAMISKLDFAKDAPTLRVTFHDPCYLGRHNLDYMTPRLALVSIPGVELVEMGRKMADALCCGGGGGNFYTDVLGSGPDSSARARVCEAFGTGAEVIATACPKCAKMLDDAVKDEDLQDKLKVMDLAEVITARLA